MRCSRSGPIGRGATARDLLTQTYVAVGERKQVSRVGCVASPGVTKSRLTLALFGPSQAATGGEFGHHRGAAKTKRSSEGWGGDVGGFVGGGAAGA